VFTPNSRNNDFNRTVTQYPESIIAIDSEDKSITTFILPKTLTEWPTFSASIHYSAVNRNIFYRRNNALDQL
jgi:hypothetical protein